MDQAATGRQYVEPVKEGVDEQMGPGRVAIETRGLKVELAQVTDLVRTFKINRSLDLVHVERMMPIVDLGDQF